MASKSFLHGMQSAFNLFPPERRDKPLLITDTDAESFIKDIKSVGDDMRYAIKALVPYDIINHQ